MINDNTRYDPKHCGLSTPGHKTHYVHCNVMRDKKRYQAKVDLISPYALRITRRAQAEVLYYHDAVALPMKCLTAIDGDIQYCPESKPALCQDQWARGRHQGVVVFCLPEQGRANYVRELGQ
jgi:hypothetical protein